MLRTNGLDPADTLEQSKALVKLAVRYLHDVAIVHIGREAEWTPGLVKSAMGPEIAMLDYLCLYGCDAIAQAVVEYHDKKMLQDFPRPMGAQL